MRGVFVVFAKFMTNKQDMKVDNLPLFIIALTILILAIVICITISKKNKLYIKPEKKDNTYLGSET